ncbi:hypothetical protein F2Q69_00056696 [Brassica cretica]|uniref:Uncharacterized protein n=1 Tax=Brassica cretica TaxID=69181 RepID=A0A8S9NA55_BRACR|nr:hypothetical protein F2Q69_00056696 [Brassica cretica]
MDPPDPNPDTLKLLGYPIRPRLTGDYASNENIDELEHLESVCINILGRKSRKIFKAIPGRKPWMMCHMAPQPTRLEGLLTVEFEHNAAPVRYKSYRHYGTLSMSLTSVSPQLSETSEGSFE